MCRLLPGIQGRVSHCLGRVSDQSNFAAKSAALSTDLIQQLIARAFLYQPVRLSNLSLLRFTYIGRRYHKIYITVSAAKSTLLMISL